MINVTQGLMLNEKSLEDLQSHYKVLINNLFVIIIAKTLLFSCFY